MSLIQVTTHGIEISLRVQPGAKKNAVLGEYAGMLKVSVVAPPEDGRANEAIVKLLAKEIGVSKSQVEIRAGSASRQKKVLISGVDEQDMLAWLQRLGIRG